MQQTRKICFCGQQPETTFSSRVVEKKAEGLDSRLMRGSKKQLEHSF